MSAAKHTLIIQQESDASPAIEMGGMKFRGKREIIIQDGRVLVDGTLKGVFVGSYGVVCKSGKMAEINQSVESKA